MVEKETVVGEPTWNLKNPIPGSKIYVCTICKTEIWVSRDSQDMIENGAQTMCRPCALKSMTDSDKLEIPPGAEATLSYYLKRRVTREELLRYVEQMKRAD